MLISEINIAFNCKVSWTPFEIEFHHRDGDSRSRWLRNSYSARVDRDEKKKKKKKEEEEKRERERKREKKGGGRFVTSRKGIRRDGGK